MLTVSARPTEACRAKTIQSSYRLRRLHNPRPLRTESHTLSTRTHSVAEARADNEHLLGRSHRHRYRTVGNVPCLHWEVACTAARPDSLGRCRTDSKCRQALRRAARRHRPVGAGHSVKTLHRRGWVSRRYLLDTRQHRHRDSTLDSSDLRKLPRQTVHRLCRGHSAPLHSRPRASRR
jgi:hypothetical protein